MPRIKLFISLILLIGSGRICLAQTPAVLNVYAAVTDFPACSPCVNPCDKVTVDDPSGFAAGDEVLLIQMKGADISWLDDSTFGTITTYGSAGFHEVLTIAAVNTSTNLITFTTSIAGNYSVAGKVQLVKKFYSATNYTVSSSGITSSPWDGTKGGVVFMEVNGILTLNGNIDVTGMGFIGGLNPNNNLDITVCGTGGPSSNPYAYGIYFLDDTSHQWAGRKGEGIVEFQNPKYELGKGPLASGGGGGLNHNSGGGGGSNMGAGGKGGNAYIGLSNSICGVEANGWGGKVLNRMGGLRMFLGGGGGAGHENNHRGNSGGDGGGIIIIKANKIEGNGNKIISDGFIGVNYAGVQGGLGDNDGGGGGGAGGSIKIETTDFGTTALTIQARGGNGGSLTASDHGPGGGGGGGLVCFSASSINNPLVSVVSTGGNAGITGDSINYGAVNGGVGLTAYSCSSISATPPKDIPFSAGSDQLLCSPATATLDTKLSNSSYTFTWYKDGSMISGAKDSAYTVNASGTYVVKVSTPYCVTNDTVIVTKKGNEVPLNQNFCSSSGPVSVTLQIGNTDPAAHYGWYTSATGGTLLGVGTSYTLSSVTKDTTVYVVDTTRFTSSLGPNGAGGSQVYYVGDASSNDITLQEHYRKFNVLAPIVLNSVQVRAALNAGGCGYNNTYYKSVTISLYQNGVFTGTSATGNAQCDVLTTIPLNFSIPVGNNYELRINGINKGDFNLNNQYQSFSIPSVFTMLANYAESGAFLNWSITYGATCDRMPVWAKSNCSLPVTLLSFLGWREASDIKLLWNTAEEKNISYYIVERSNDANSFYSIGSINAKGNGQYFFIDNNVKENECYYYRIKIIDKDGAFSYSSVVYVSSDDNFLFEIYPNPVSDQLSIRLNSQEDSELIVDLIDVPGRILISRVFNIQKGQNNLSMNTSSLAPGIYFLRCNSRTKNYEVKKIKKE